MHNTEHKRQGLIGHTPKHGVWKFSGVSSTLKLSVLSVRTWRLTGFVVCDQSVESPPNCIVTGAYCSSTPVHLTHFPVHISNAGPSSIRCHTPLGVIYSITEGLYVEEIYFLYIVHMLRDAAIRRQRATHLSPTLDIQVLLHIVSDKSGVKIIPKTCVFRKAGETTSFH